MANLATNADIINDALDRVGEKSDGTSDFDPQALIYYNRVYRMVWMGGNEIAKEVNEDWWWLRKYPPGSMVLQPKIEAGTVNVTQDSVSITFSSAPSVSVKDWHIKIVGEPDIHRIATHIAAATAATLKDKWTGATKATASFKVFQLEYDLGVTDLLRLISPMRVFRNQFGERHEGEIEGVDLKSMELRSPLKYVESGTPTSFSVVYETDNKITVRFNRYVSDRTRVEFDYLAAPADLADDTAEPILPLQYRYILSDGIAWLLALIKNDTQADTLGLMFQNGVRAMAIENKRRNSTMERSFGWIYPNANERTHYRTRTTSGLILIP